MNTYFILIIYFFEFTRLQNIDEYLIRSINLNFSASSSLINAEHVRKNLNFVLFLTVSKHEALLRSNDIFLFFLKYSSNSDTIVRIIDYRYRRFVDIFRIAICPDRQPEVVFKRVRAPMSKPIQRTPYRFIGFIEKLKQNHLLTIKIYRVVRPSSLLVVRL